MLLPKVNMEPLKTLHFSVAVHAPAARVWWALWNDTHYRQWASVFSERPYVDTEWNRGAGVYFLSQSGDGLFSRITKIEEEKRVLFTHECEVKKHVEQPLDDDSIQWSGFATEEYVLTEQEGTTLLEVTRKTIPKQEEYFKTRFPKGLAILKSLAENFMLICELEMVGRLSRVWECWTEPSHITGWNFADKSWHSPRAVNDLKVGGKFNYRMEAKDGSAGFDFEGIYISVIPKNYIEYVIVDGRKVKISFSEKNYSIRIVQSFEPENETPLKLQQQGWQAIMENFKKYYKKNS